jgi:hypothetical protein
MLERVWNTDRCLWEGGGVMKGGWGVQSKRELLLSLGNKANVRKVKKVRLSHGYRKHVI